MSESTTEAFRFLPGLLAAPTAKDHKYSRGVVTLATGSVLYPGAALLGTEAAARCGAGMVRFSGPREVAMMVVARTPEIVPSFGKSQTVVAGSGWEAMPEEGASVPSGEDPRARMRSLSRQIHEHAPFAFTVLDASALPAADLLDRPAETVILTPHAGEGAQFLTRVLAPGERRPRPHTRGPVWSEQIGMAEPAPAPSEAWPRERVEAEPRAAAELIAARTGYTVILKGHTTWIAAPHAESVSITAPTTRLATAGTGDVLAGVLGAVLARVHGEVWGPTVAGDRRPILRACAAAVELHGAAAGAAAELHGAAASIAARASGAGSPFASAQAALPQLGGPILAHDISAALPRLIAGVEATAGRPREA